MRGSLLLPATPRPVAVRRAQAIQMLVRKARAIYDSIPHTDIQVIHEENILRMNLLTLGCTPQELAAVFLADPVQRAYLWEGI